jgi:hypothetical protein
VVNPELLWTVVKAVTERFGCAKGSARRAHIENEIFRMAEAFPLYPCSALLGCLTDYSSVVLVVDLSDGVFRDVIAGTAFHPAVSILDMLISEVSRVLKEHLQESQYFNVVTIQDEPHTWCESNVRATAENVDNACLFLRHSRPGGRRRVDEALGAAALMHPDAIHLLIHGLPEEKPEQQLQHLSHDKCSGNYSTPDVKYNSTTRPSRTNLPPTKGVKSRRRTVGKRGDGSKSSRDKQMGIEFVPSQSQDVVAMLRQTTATLMALDHKSRIDCTGFTLGESSRCVGLMNQYLEGIAGLTTSNPGVVRIVSTGSASLSSRMISSAVDADNNEAMIPASEAVIWQVLAMGSFLVMMTCIVADRAGLLGPGTTAGVSAKYPSWLSASSALYVLWKVAFLCVAAIVIFICHADRTHANSAHLKESVPVADRVVRRLGFLVPMYAITCIAWLLLLKSECLIEASAVSVVQVLVLLVGYVRIRGGRQESMESTLAACKHFAFHEDFLFLQAPISVLLGWSTFCCISTVSMAFVQSGMLWYGFESEWVPFVVAGLGLSTFQIARITNDETLPGVIALCMFGMGWANGDDHVLSAQATDGEYNMGTVLFVLCTLSGVALSIQSFTLALVRYRVTSALRAFGPGQDFLIARWGLQRTQFTTMIQVANVTCWVALVAVFWGDAQVMSGSCGTAAKALASRGVDNGE